MDEKLNSVLQKILAAAKKYPELGEQLRVALQVGAAPASSPLNSDKVDQIYEYCIEEVLKGQAKDFYAGSSLSAELVPSLERDFVSMETERRKGNFEGFCLALYRQIEQITNYLCENRDLDFIASRMWAYPAYVQWKKDKKKKGEINERDEASKQIAEFVLVPGEDLKIKSGRPLSNLQAMDKVRTVTYFVGYQARIFGSEWNNWKTFTDIVHEIYLCRCQAAHAGNSANKVVEKILPLKEFYTFKFLGVLVQFITYVKEGWGEIPKMREYAETLPVKSVRLPGLKVVGKLDPSALRRK